MAPRDDNDVRVTPSLLDRLLGEEPQRVREEKGAVKRDLENLLNSRNSFPDLPAAFVEAGRSVLTHGLPDFSGLNPSHPNDQNRLSQLIESVIRAFEPRLSGVSVTLIPDAGTERSLRLRIDARLLIDPAPEPVSFDVVMPVQTMACEVREAS